MKCCVRLRQTLVWPLLVIFSCLWMLLASQPIQAEEISELGVAFGAASLLGDNSVNNNLLPQEDTQDENKEQNQQRQQQEEGSWLHWWSYDGISGPEFWNINKRWRLCSLGRKQSPIDIEPERLVYDHLLGPIKLSWLPAGGSSLPVEEAAGRSAPAATEEENDDDDDDDDGDEGEQAVDRDSRQKTGLDGSEDEARRKQPGGAAEETTSNSQSKPVKVQLYNSGRGIEVWLEGMPIGGRQQSEQQKQQEEQLILSQGPLSYAYKLFKLELHSAAKSSSSSSPQLTTQQIVGSTQKSSEHTISGRAFDAELQLHFYNRHLASSVIEAQQHLAASPASSSASGVQDARPNLFAAISVFLLAVDTSNTSTTSSDSHHKHHPHHTSNSSSKHLGALDFVLDNFAAIQNQGNWIELQVSKRHIEALVTSRRQYITYQGSLNRPPCAEGVDWILLNKALRVDGQKLQGLFVSEKLNTNQENVRPVKPLNGRLLRTTISLSPSANSGSKISKKGRRRLKKLDQQQQQHQQPSFSSGTGCPEMGASANTRNQENCTSANLERAPTKMETGGLGELQQHHHQQQRQLNSQPCSMKPNYVYQLGLEFSRETKQQQRLHFRQEL